MEVAPSVWKNQRVNLRLNLAVLVRHKIGMNDLWHIAPTILPYSQFTRLTAQMAPFGSMLRDQYERNIHGHGGSANAQVRLG